MDLLPDGIIVFNNKMEEIYKNSIFDELFKSKNLDDIFNLQVTSSLISNTDPIKDLRADNREKEHS